jgi:hypothetical protein
MTNELTFDIGKRLNCPRANISGINTIGLMLRMELYVDEDRWNKATEETKLQLNSLIDICEDKIIPTLLHWNE